MPFTLFHFGPHACLALPLRRYIDVPTFIAANIAVDIEPLLVIACGLNYPVHGYCHTFLLGSLVGALLGMVMFRFCAHAGRAISLPGLLCPMSRSNLMIPRSLLRGNRISLAPPGDQK